MNDSTTLKGRQLHFIAIGGAGMSGLALVCRELGAEVTGSDRAESTYVDRLRAAGIEPFLGHDAGQVPDGAEVIVSTAITEDNPELARARERGQRVLHRGELLAELCAKRRLLAIAGTHGKTTTAAMCIHALRESGADPSFFLGGELPGAGPGGEPTNAGWGEGKWVVAEADESDASFLRLQPEVAVITNLELDHHSRWSSLAELTEAFAAFAASTASIAVGAEVELPGRPGVAEARRGGAAPHPDERRQVRFTLEPERPGSPARPADLIATEIRAEPGGGVSCHVSGAGIEVDVSLSVPGRHNVANALAALAGLSLAGADVDACAKALAGFKGVARRLELKGERNGARIYDDYAHHPTEVAATLAAARELEPGRLIAAFQPHLYSRTKALAAELGAALAAADEVAVLEVYPAREEPVGALAGVSGRMVAEAAADHAGGRPVWWLPDADAAASALGPRLSEGDLLVTIGAGDIFRLAEALVAENGGGAAGGDER
jgi:UDP-N-acetylmuramate--alanine ligase